MPSVPALEDLLRRAAARERRRRVVWGLAGGAAAGGALGCVLAVWRIVEGASSGEPFSFATVAYVAVGIAAAGAAVALLATLGPRDEAALAREIDRRLGLEDRTATALAIARERVVSRLAPFVVAQSAPIFQQAAPRIDEAFSSGPGARTVRNLRRVAVLFWLVLLVFGVLEILRLFDFGFGLFARGPLDVGILPADDPSAPSGNLPAPKGPPGEQGAERSDPKGSDGGEGDRPEPPEDEPSPPEDRPEPDVQVNVRPAREEFGPDEPVLVVASVAPTRDLPEERDFVLSLEVDGKSAATRVTWKLDPSTVGSRGEIQDLRRLPGLEEKLTPGEHEVTAEVRDAKTGETFRSRPAKFRIDGGMPSPQPPQPEPQPEPQPQPEPKPKPPDPAVQPEPPPGTKEPPPSDESAAPPPPEIAPQFDPRVVVPLFGEGEEVTKKGLRIVLAPGGGPAESPRHVPAAEAVPEAARRAESHVDRAGLRAEDREVVRRYFEALLRGLR